MTAPRCRATPGRALSALLALVVAGLSAGAAPPAAAAEGSAAITWAVSPSTNGAPDERAWVELDADPGTTTQEEAVVRNLSTETVTFRLTAADGYFTEKGRFTMLSSDQESVDAGTWISAPATVTVEAGGTGVVPFSVSVPEDATPGDHAAGLAASVLSQGSEAGGATVGVESRVGFRVMTRVTGELAPSLLIDDVRSDYRLSWNPFQPGSLSVVADVVNTGNVRLLLGGTASVQGNSTPLIAKDETQQELLPSDRRSVAIMLDGVWPLFAVGIDFVVAPTVVTPSEKRIAVAPISQSVTVPAIPVSQLLFVLGIALILLAVIAGRARSQRRITKLVREAKNEGLLEGAQGSAASTPSTENFSTANR